MGLSVVSGVNASSHREAPLISQDPVADNTDVYAFRSPDAPDMVTLIANWIPAEDPAAGPNYYHFGEDVLYAIHIDNDGDAVEDVSYEWRFRDDIQNPDTFLYATGVIGDERGDEGTVLDDPDYNYRQRYDVFEVRDGKRTPLLEDVIMPPDNIGLATNDYEPLAQAGNYDFDIPADGGGGSGKTFSGQRDDAFFADIGSIFDLGQLRPFLPNSSPRRARPRRAATSSAATTSTRPRSRCRSATWCRQRAGHRRLVDGVPVRRCASSARTTAPTRSTAAGSCRCRASATRSSTRSSSRWPQRTPSTRCSRATTPQR
jgi:hypothetical protein